MDFIFGGLYIMFLELFNWFICSFNNAALCKLTRQYKWEHYTVKETVKFRGYTDMTVNILCRKYKITGREERRYNQFTAYKLYKPEINEYEVLRSHK